MALRLSVRKLERLYKKDNKSIPCKSKIAKPEACYNTHHDSLMNVVNADVRLGKEMKIINKEFDLTVQIPLIKKCMPTQKCDLDNNNVVD